MEVHEREQVEAALLTTPAHLVAAEGAPALGMPLAAVHPTVIGEPLLGLGPGGALGELGGAPLVHVVLQHAVVVGP